MPGATYPREPGRANAERMRAVQQAVFEAEAAETGEDVEVIRRRSYSEMGLKAGANRKISAIERRVRELVEAAPPLSEDQLDRLQAIFRGAEKAS